MAEGEKAKRKIPVRRRFAVFQILDESGQPMEVGKEQVKLIAITASATEVLEVMEGGQHKHATYRML